MLTAIRSRHREPIFSHPAMSLTTPFPSTRMPNFQGKSIHHLMYTLETQDDVDQAAGSLLFKGRAALSCFERKYTKFLVYHHRVVFGNKE